MKVLGELARQSSQPVKRVADGPRTGWPGSARRSLVGDELLPQYEFLDLPRRRHWKTLHELPIPRRLVRRQVFAAESEELIGRRSLAGGRPNECRHLLAPPGVR